ncbi:MAG: response regulator [Planctomycetaceae bacterium]|nr:response regulator [Planctomycetaceae bacterium]
MAPPATAHLSGLDPRPHSGIPQPAPSPDARLQLLDAMRGEMLQSIEAIVLNAQMLRDEASDRPPEMLDDLDRLLNVARELYDFVKLELGGEWLDLEPAAFTERLRRTRHDIGNRLNHALGYCQFLIIDERDRHFGRLVEDLEVVQRHCRDCESTLVHFKSIAEGLKPADSSSVSLSTSRVVPHQRTPAVDHRFQPATILVVDDSRTTCDLLAKFLKKERHSVLTVEDGPCALALLEKQDVDLILLDFQMPGMSGLEVLQRIKSDERLRHVPVIMVSALDSVSDVAPCIEYGADDYLTKPVEFTLLRARVNSSLERARLREREFGQFFTPEVARLLLRNPELIREGREAEVTVLFCDIRGFSRISEKLAPSVTVAWLSDVMAELSECVLQHSGVLVDYIGDELMAMWGAPTELPNHAALACAAASDMLERLPVINQRWQETIKEVTDVGIGLNSGVSRVGNTGSTQKFKYGPLGSAVNLASRIQGATKYLGSRLLVTGHTMRLIAGQFSSRRLCQVRMVNIHEPVELFEIHAVQNEVACRLARKYERALEHFEQRRLPDAAAVLGELLVEHPHDGPSLLLMSRVVDALLHQSQPPELVWQLPGK